MTEEIVPTLNSITSQIKGLHTDICTNNLGDHLTRVILSVMVAALVVTVIMLAAWIHNTRKTVSKVSQGLTVIFGEMKIRPSKVFPTVHY